MNRTGARDKSAAAQPTLLERILCRLGFHGEAEDVPGMIYEGIRSGRLRQMVRCVRCDTRWTRLLPRNHPHG